VTSRERFRELTESGVIPAPSGAGAVVIHTEDAGDCLVVLSVRRLADRTDRVAIVTLVGCMQSVFGYPNDQAYIHDPRGAETDGPVYGFYEVLSSAWPGRLMAYNRHGFPDTTPEYFSSLRHFFIGCHDASGEFLADDLRVEITDGSFGEALREAMWRTLGPASA
jgi:hypothetical protein